MQPQAITEAVTNLAPVEREDVLPVAAPTPVASVELFELEPESQRVDAMVTMLLASGGARLEQEVRQDLAITLGELLLNAIEHGCLGISYEEKSAALAGGQLATLREERRADPRLSGRRVWVQVVWTRTQVRFVIRDEGPGFDWRNAPDPTDPENLLRENGRGLAIAQWLVDSMQFNERGNEVTAIKRL
ncbi:MAG: ATP-binding protein [Myxococcota bacterium]